MVFRRDVGLFMDQRGHPRKIGVPGEADIQGIQPGGRAVAIEVKVGRDKRRPHQEAWATRFVQVGGLYCLAVANTEDDIKKILDKF